MPLLKGLDDLRKIRDASRNEMRTREGAATRIIVGMGTCGIAAGARDVMAAILEELSKRNIEANVTTTGCIGMCTEEPLVDIERAGEGRITYSNITPDRVPRLIEEHLVRGRIPREWSVGRMAANTAVGV